MRDLKCFFCMEKPDIDYKPNAVSQEGYQRYSCKCASGNYCYTKKLAWQSWTDEVFGAVSEAEEGEKQAKNENAQQAARDISPKWGKKLIPSGYNIDWSGREAEPAREITTVHLPGHGQVSVEQMFEIMTDEWIFSGNNCAETQIDMRNLIRQLLKNR